MTPRSLRALRGAGAAASATILAAVSHTIGGGGAPDAALVVVMALLLAPIATAMVGSRLQPGRLAATVLVSQIGFHAAFAAVGASSGGSRSGLSEGASGLASSSDAHAHSHSGTSALGVLGVPSDVGAMGSVMPMLDPVMAAAHVAAALASFLLLYRGEAALHAIAAFVVEILALRPATPLHVTPRPAAPAPTADVAAPHSAALRRAVRRRGPPAFSIAH